MTEPVTIGRFLRMTGRGLSLRCPSCGNGSLLKTWRELKPRCPTCGFLLDRGEPDFWIGGYAVNIVAGELFVVLILLAVIVGTWPEVPWGFVQYGGLVLAVLIPIAFFPVSRVLWLAWDYCFRQVRD